MIRTILASLAIILTCSISRAQSLQNENLLQTVPKGYKIGFQQRQGSQSIMEFIPAGQTVNNWTDMLTSNVYYGGLKLSPKQIYQAMNKQWSGACPGGKSAFLKEGKENGYPFAFWMLSCPRNPATGKPETTFFKAIQGNDSTYMVQKATKSKPTKKYAARWAKYLSTVTVCDSRIAGRSCPQGKAQPAQ